MSRTIRRFPGKRDEYVESYQKKLGRDGHTATRTLADTTTLKKQTNKLTRREWLYPEELRKERARQNLMYG